MKRPIFTILLYILLGSSLAIAQEKIRLAPVQTGNLSNFGAGYIDEKGEMIVKPDYNEAYEFSEDFAAFRKTDKWGFIRRGSTKLITPQFGMVRNFREGLAPARTGMVLDASWGFVDTSGLYAIGAAFKDVGEFSGGLANVCIHANTLNGKWGFINRRGEMIIEASYDRALPFEDGLARVNMGGGMVGLWGYIDSTGKVVVPIIYAELGAFRDGLAPVNTSKGLKSTTLAAKWGFIDKTGKLVIEAKFLDAKEFSHGLAAAKQSDKYPSLWGFIDNKGQWVINPQYYDVKTFCEGVAAFKDKGKWGLINTKGEIIHEAFFQDITFPFNHGLIPVKKDGKWGYLNPQGKWVIQPKFIKAGRFN